MATSHSPRTLAKRAELFDQLAALIEAGIPLIRALEMQTTSPSGKLWRKPIASIVAKLEQGKSVAEALQEPSEWLSPFDLSLLTAGAKSGRLNTAFSTLAEQDRQHANMLREISNGLLYPLVLLHVALFVFPVQLLVNAVVHGEVTALLLQKAMVFGVFYLAWFLWRVLTQLMGSNVMRGMAESLAQGVPFYGSARRAWALSRVAAVLDGLLAAGVTVQQAWPEAAAACGSPLLEKTVVSWSNKWAQGETPSETMKRSRVFPRVFADLYATGEMSGSLDTALVRIRKYYQEEAIQKMTLFSALAPKLIYVLIVCGVAYSIFDFWSGYFRKMQF